MKLKNIILSALVLLGFTSFSGVANAGCGKLVIAEQNWASAELMANVDKVILEKGYGCEVELIPGATMPTFTSMDEKGAPDMNPEQWANAVYTPLKKAVSEKRFSNKIKRGPSSLCRRIFICNGKKRISASRSICSRSSFRTSRSSISIA